MGTYLKYRFLTLVREKSFMFWALAFPLILAVLFYVSFGNPAGDGMGEKMQSVPARGDHGGKPSFLCLPRSLDGT